MSIERKKQQSRFTRPDAQLVVTIVAVGLAALALFVALRIDRRVELEASEDVTIDQAEAILERANEATAFADSILSFLEGASVVVGAALAVGAWMLRNSIQKQIDATSVFIEQTEARFEAREKRLDELEVTLTARLDKMVTDTGLEISRVQQQAQDSFRVLSLLVLAEQQVRAHNIDTAIRTLQAAYDLAPNNQATNYLLGYLFTTRKQFDDAITRLECALEADPEFAPAIAALGLALRRKGDVITDEGQITERNTLWAQAEIKLLEALSLDSRLTDAEGESYYGTLGGLYRRQRRYDDALRAYELARQVTPNSSYPIINLATLYAHKGDMGNACPYFEMVVKTAELKLDDDPLDYWTRADYAQANLVLGDTKKALEQLHMLLDQGPERYVLETVRSGLRFLNESPTPIDGLDDMLRVLDQVLDAS